jgi:hypothetical protein
MKPELQKIFTKLAKEKVELGLIDDLKKEFAKINKAKNEIEREANIIDKAIFGFRDVLNNYQTTKYISLLGKYQKAAKELGVSVDTKYQKAFDEYLQEKNKQADRILKR